MKIALTLAAALLVGGAAVAQQTASYDLKGMDMSSMHQDATTASSTSLHQGGQAAFAAIAEATSALESNPTTDWSKVNIDALRDHLVDMDNVTVHAIVTRTNLPGGARFDITSSDPRVRQSIDRMTRLHSSMANKDGDYHLVPKAIPNGTGLTVTGPTALDQAKIRGLGFFGLLTQGVHHELHHMMLAKGEPMDH